VSLTTLDLVFLNSVIDIAATGGAIGANIQGIFKCSGLAVWGPRTQGGKSYQLRNIDLFVGSGLESQAVVIIEKPEGGLRAFANATWAGMVGSASGMNESGVALSQVWAFSLDSSIGQPWILTTRKILETADNVDAVWPAFSNVTRTYGSNFVFSDRGVGRGGVRRGICLEQTHTMLAQFDANDPKEDAAYQGTPIAIRLPNAVFRGDTPMCQMILDKDYNVGTSDPRTHGGYNDRYKQTADLVTAYEQKGVLIGPAEMETISRTIGMASGSLQCVVYEQDDLVLHVANSRLVPGGQPAMARDEPYHVYDFDYYLPTATVVTDKSSYKTGDTVQIAVTVGNHGRDRHLSMNARLECGGASVALGATPAASVDALNGQTATATANVVVPAGIPAGQGNVIIELIEYGTHDIVDYALTPVVIQ
jgi:hypothetical protein